MSHVVAATWTVRPGHEHEIGELLAELTTAAREEPGCLEYRAHRSTEDERVFFIYERYADRAAFDAHIASEHFQRLGLERATPLLEDRGRAFFTALND
jgi:quinol monooxygenase YgiN